MFRIKNVLISFLVMLSVHSSAQKVVAPAKPFFEQFTEMDNLWNAADVTITLPLEEEKNLWVFGDTFVGPRTGPYTMNGEEVTMIRNSAILENQGEMDLKFSGTEAEPGSWIPDRDSSFFWPEHAVLEQDTLRVFAIEVFYADNDDPMFNFHVGKSHIASFTYPELEHVHSKAISSLTDTTLRFGAQVIQEGAYTYIFGKRDTTENGWTWPLPYLARTSGSVTEQWEFYDGNQGWTDNSFEAAPIGDRPVSESFFVYKRDGKYYMLLHEIWLVPELYILQADSITGPWNKASTGGVENHFAVLQMPQDNFTYNLFAHPQFENDGKLLISYNVNTSDFGSIFGDTRNYRARFYWLSTEAAVDAAYPDTLNITEDFDNTLHVDEDQIQPSFLEYLPGNQTLKAKKIKGTIKVFDLSGKLFINKKIHPGQPVSINRLPRQVYVVVFENPQGRSVRKIVKH